MQWFGLVVQVGGSGHWMVEFDLKVRGGAASVKVAPAAAGALAQGDNLLEPLLIQTR